MLTPLLTLEVGSLAKPAWRVKVAAGRPLDEADICDARAWGERLGVDGYERLLDLSRKPSLAPPERQEVKDWSSRYGLRFFESAGLDVVYDGEQQRSEMYASAIAHAVGFETRGNVRSFDDKYYTKSAVTGPIVLREPYHDQEFRLLQAAAQRPVKIPVTGPYTLGVWSFDEHYLGPADLTVPLVTRRRQRAAARRQFIMDIARNLVGPNIEALPQLGASWIQIDEPGGSTEPDEIALVAQAYNACVDGLDPTFSTHLCFSDYRLFFPGIAEMTGCAQFAVGFANNDSRELGTSDDARPGYQIIRAFRDLPVKPALGLGVPRHPHRLRRAAGADPGPDPPRRPGLRRPGAAADHARLRAAHPFLGDRLLQARQHGRRRAPRPRRPWSLTGQEVP
jgi:5-methyltetrahydropteroyltriglutamate--homocysteine methyltransferase